MIDVRAIAHATLETSDIERSVEYYTQVLGLHVSYRDSHRTILVTHVGRETLVLENGSAARLTRLALQVAPGTDLGDVGKMLYAREGIRTELYADITPGISQALVFQDPIGTIVELFADNTPSRRREPSGIGPLKLGHVAFCCLDVRHQTDFYCRLLGFRVSDWMEDMFSFLRCGHDHHTVNFAAAHSTKLHHMAFELKDWAHIGAACEILGRRNMPIIWGPGRHGIGHNVFVYHRNPDDQIVEVFTDIDVMLDERLGYFEPRAWHRDNPQRPKVWRREDAAMIWGPPPTPDYFRGKD